MPRIVLFLMAAMTMVDKVPLVAASMGRYSLVQFPPDHFFWEFLAYCAGTGGSIQLLH